MNANLINDIAELAKRLNKYNEFYHSLIEAKFISFKSHEYLQDSIEVVQVDKAEWERWKKIQSIIDNFECP